jgi:nitronate monooxygenase
MPPLEDLTGLVEEMALYAGQSAGLVGEVLPAADIVNNLTMEATAQLQSWTPG